MTARVSPLAIAGAWKIQAVANADARGNLSEWFKDSDLRDATGHGLHVRQANWSISRRGVLRGIKVNSGELVKYVTCVRGAVLDVVVDLRVGSPTFGHWQMEQLDEDNHTALYIAEGLGHAFLSLVDDSMVMYLLSETAQSAARAQRPPARPRPHDHLAHRHGTAAVTEGFLGAGPARCPAGRTSP